VSESWVFLFFLVGNLLGSIPTFEFEFCVVFWWLFSGVLLVSGFWFSSFCLVGFYGKSCQKIYIFAQSYYSYELEKRRF